jgi:hypothetical protein
VRAVLHYMHAKHISLRRPLTKYSIRYGGYRCRHSPVRQTDDYSYVQTTEGWLIDRGSGTTTLPTIYQLPLMNAASVAMCMAALGEARLLRK